jgi:DNA-binding NtrC family response regulator
MVEADGALTMGKQRCVRSISNGQWFVEELENAIERPVVLATPPEIAAADLPASIRSLGEKKIYESDNKLSNWIEKLEEEALRQALLECEGNISQTAKKLGIGRATIYRKAKKYGLPMVK